MRQRKRAKEIDVPARSPAWFAARRLITATRASIVAGLNSYVLPRDECIWILEHNDEPHPSSAATIAGDENEYPIACRAYRMLFPLGDPQLRPEARGRGEYGGMRKGGVFLHPLYEDMVSATPDFILEGHHDWTEDQPVIMEIKLGMYALAYRPKLEHLVQVVVQMEVVNAPFAFLSYGFGKNCTVVFLVERCESLWKWLLPRFFQFQRAITSRTPYPDNRTVPHIAREVETYWRTGLMAEWILRAYPASRPEMDVRKSFMPPEPSWELAALSLDDGELNVSAYKQQLATRSWTCTVSPRIRAAAATVVAATTPPSNGDG